jgi:hypothetical protein
MFQSTLESTRATLHDLAIGSKTDLLCAVMHHAEQVQYVEPQEDHNVLTALCGNASRRTGTVRGTARRPQCSYCSVR